MKTLREWRMAKLLSIDDLAERAGVSNKTIVQIEYGRQLPRFRTMRRISDALNVEPDEIEEFATSLGELKKDVA